MGSRIQCYRARGCGWLDRSHAAIEAFDPLLTGAKLFQCFEQHDVVDRAVLGIEHRAQRVRKRGLEVLELLCVEPAGRRQGRFAQTFDALLAEGDLENSQSVERDFDSGALGEELDVGGVSVAGGNAELVRRPECSFDRGREHACGSRRCLAWAVLADQSHLDPALGKGDGNGQSDYAAADNDYLGAQLADSGCLLS